MKNKQETSEKLIKMLKVDGYTTVNLSDFSYYQNYYKPISIDLSKKSKKNSNIPQKIRFTRTLEEDVRQQYFYC